MKRLVLAGLLCSAIFLAPAVCRAQEMELEKIEVKGKEKVRPYSFFLLTEEEIKRQNSRDTGDVLKKIPGISARRTGLWGLDPSLRGLKEDQVNLLIDGVKAWGACPGRMDPPSSQVGPQELEAIEVIKGPFSVRHGAGSLGGVINLVTKQPKHYEKPQINGNLSLGYDSVADGKKGKFNLYGGDKPYDYRLSVGGRRYNDYDTPDGEIDNSGFKDVGYSAKIGLNPADYKRLDLSLSQNLRKDVGHPARSMDSERAKNFLSSIKYSQEKISPWLNALTGQIYYNRAEHLMNNDKRAGFNTMAMETESESDTYGGKLEAVFDLGKSSSLASGLDYYRLRRDADRTRIMKTGMMPMTTLDKPWNNARIHDWGFYSELQSAVSPKLGLQIGARADLVEANSNLPDQNFLTQNNGANLEQKETNLSGNIGLAYALDEHFALTAAVGRGVRTADANERYSNYFPASKYLDKYEYLGNPELDPEKSLEFDLGASVEFERFSLGLSFFYNQVDDYISATNTSLAKKNMSSAGVKRYVNIDAVLKGFELEGQLKISRNLSLGADLTYTEGKNRDSNTDLAQIPPLEGNLRLRYDEETLWAECSGRFVDKQDKIDSNFAETETPGFATFGLTLGIIPLENYSIVLGVENIFDKKYSEHLNGNNTYSGGKLLEPGRNLFARLAWNF